MLFRRARSTSAEQVQILAQLRLENFMQRLESLPWRMRRRAAARQLLSMYRSKRPFPNLGHFRLGPNMFDETPLDWIVVSANGRLAGHGVAARIPWDGQFASLCGGWQRTVRLAYETSMAGKVSNTLVGLFI